MRLVKYKGLTIDDLKNMLNELDAKMRDASNSNELGQLLLARSAIKDSIIEHLEYELSQVGYRKVKRAA